MDPNLGLFEASGGRSQVREQSCSWLHGLSPVPGAPSSCAVPGGARRFLEVGNFGAGTGVPGARVAVGAG